MPIKIFCFSNEIKYQTDDKNKFNSYELQALSEGLRVVYGEYFPYKITDGKIDFPEKYLSDFDKAELKVISLKEYKEKVSEKINQYFENSFADITKKYPSTEREGWFFLTAECLDWLQNGELTNIPALHAECDLTKDFEKITLRAKEILEKSNTYKSFYGKMKSQKSYLQTELKNAETAKKVFEIENSLSG